MELTFTLKLSDAMKQELIDACQDCNCSPKQFAAESLEAVLAERRIDKVIPGKLGAHFGGR